MGLDASRIAEDCLEKGHFRASGRILPGWGPDWDRLLIGGRADQIDEKLVDAAVVGELGVKRGSEKVALTDEDRQAIAAGKNLDTGAGFEDFWSANEDHLQRAAGKRGFGGDDGGVDLAAVAVALDNRVEQAERALRRVHDRAGEQDGPGAGAEDGMAGAEFGEELKEIVLLKEAKDGGGFPTGEDEAVEGLAVRAEVLRSLDKRRLSAGFGKRVGVGGVVALDGEDADFGILRFGQRFTRWSVSPSSLFD